MIFIKIYLILEWKCFYIKLSFYKNIVTYTYLFSIIIIYNYEVDIIVWFYFKTLF